MSAHVPGPAFIQQTFEMEKWNWDDSQLLPWQVQFIIYTTDGITDS